MPRRRFQRGRLPTRKNTDVGGHVQGRQVATNIQAHQTHGEPYLDAVNVAPAPAPRKVGKTFSDAVQEWREQIAVNLKPSTVRAAESHLSQHIVKRLGNLPLQQANVKRL